MRKKEDKRFVSVILTILTKSLRSSVKRRPEKRIFKEF